MRIGLGLMLGILVANGAVFAQQCAEGTACGEGICEGCSADGSLGSLFSEPLFAGLKNQTLGPITYSVGGQIRHRFMNERNRFRPGGPAQSEYQLWRNTPFVTLAWGDAVSVRLEGIDASAFGYDAPLFPVGIDVNRADVLQAYADIKLADINDDGSLRYRYGRQVLKYGSQHLLSPLAWSNTFRNFEGHKLMLQSGDWSVDGFYLYSVNLASGGSDGSFRSFDKPDEDRVIAGVYSSYSGFENNTLDLYWLYFNEENDNAARMDGERNTFGARLAGERAVQECGQTVGTWNWDLEGAFQTGTDDFGALTNQDVRAGFLSAIGGYQFNELPWSPKINGIFYYGSGDDDPTDGDLNTFFSLYPLGHAYWGIIDNFSGQNLIDVGFTVTAKPSDKLTLVLAWHDFLLADDNDNLYNIAGAPFALADEDIGTEVDMIGTYAISDNMNVQAGYSWFFYGDGVDNSAFARKDARQFYVQTTVSF